MSHVRATALICACALVANAAADPAPAPPTRTVNKETKRGPETTIIVKRLPNAYFYFSLWPLPKFPLKDADEPDDGGFHVRRSMHAVRVTIDER